MAAVYQRPQSGCGALAMPDSDLSMPRLAIAMPFRTGSKVEAQQKKSSQNSNVSSIKFSLSVFVNSELRLCAAFSGVPGGKVDEQSREMTLRIHSTTVGDTISRYPSCGVRSSRRQLLCYTLCPRGLRRTLIFSTEIVLAPHPTTPSLGPPAKL